MYVNFDLVCSTVTAEMMRCWTVWPSKATSEQRRLIHPSDFQDVLVGFGFFDCLFTLHVLTQYFHSH